MKKQTENEPQSVPVGERIEEPDADPTAAAPDIVTQFRTENAELKAAARAVAAREFVTAALTAAGARSPGLLFDAVKADLQYDSDGSPANAAAMVARLKASFPEQFGIAAAPASIDGGAGRVAPPAITKEALGKMTPAEIAKLDWADVRRVLAS